MKPTLNQLQQVLLRSYGKKTAHHKYKSKWSTENPACGQCVPTALLVQHYHGGEIHKKKDHYFNVIDGKVVDLSASQFENGFDYSNSKEKQPILEQSQTLERFELLKERVETHLCDNKNKD